MQNNCADSCRRLKEVQTEQAARVRGVESFYELTANDIDGNLVQFSDFRGKIVVITNVASQCGYTQSHYASMVELYSQVRHDDLVHILAFPCNQFGSQEPGTANEIKKFAKSKGVEFTMMEKIYVNGPNTSLIYLYLKHHAGPATITWNFATYFVVDTNGEVTSHSGVEPMDLKGEIFGMLGKEEL
mmetsp:Transcript_30475/g.46148  ORF Transcript_30475/g.46148 Transcript_30475/m.46148 type:complete len:186 (-) Transcript_30475:77-634(-)|eukprot:CAMPEP_0178938718 /NCGR_PEP_ID=MMETSP0786-20121207/26485_1 /TAXON_ID=186022 /ORGANISM="Thalassionema frauenfeldii, Strain CCMP 1798" /LENGTH=185 /DNA_ID=CAMNT_0020617465 /DNA_START=247 /DNA_END=804 /DNA_ORIENTATION=+